MRLTRICTLFNSPSVRAGIDLLQFESNFQDKQIQYFDTLFGIHPIQCALQAKRRTFKRVLYRRDLLDHNIRVKNILEQCWAAGIDTKIISRKDLEAQQNKGRPNQGILAEVSRLYFQPLPCTRKPLEELIQKSERNNKKQVWLLLNGIQDPMNFGSILRSAYFLGCDQVLVPSQNNCSLSPIVSKASSGAMELFPVHSINNVPELCRVMNKDFGWDIVGTVAPSSKDDQENCGGIPCGSFQLEKSSLIILGNEGRGLGDLHPDLLTRRVFIPSYRRDLSACVDSLNVSAAAAVLLHSLMMNRHREIQIY